MKKIIILFLLFTVCFTDCKKPKIGRYALVLTYDQNNLGEATIYGDENKVTTKHIYYGGAFSDFTGTLNRQNKKVDGELILFPNQSIEETITISGVIKLDGSLGKYRIEGTFAEKIQYW